MERGKTMKKILFGITSLTLGGAERVLVDMTNELCKQYEITIFTIYAKGELEKQLNPNIKVKSLCQKPFSELSKMQQKVIMPLKVLLRKNRIYKKSIKGDYETEIAFLEGPITRLFSVKNKKVKKIAWIHNDISLVFGKGLKAKLKKYLDKKIYTRYQTLVFVSKDNFRKFREVYQELRNQYLEPIKKEVIYNYIDKNQILKKAQEEVKETFEKDCLNFVTVARLVPQKGIDRIIKVHNELLKKGLKHNFYVIGDGPEREKLEKQVKENQLENTFHLLGKKENPYPYIKHADYFCLLSHFEGYGMVLEEAKILNKPIIITDTAAREAIKDYKNAIILENTDIGIYQGLLKILKEEKKENNEEAIPYDNSNLIKQIIELVGE